MAPKATGPAKKGPPKFELEGGKKWIIENQDNNRDLHIAECEISQGVYIYKCDNCLVKIDQKVNTIILDSCKKVIFFINSTSPARSSNRLISDSFVDRTSV